jgi:hypothetical protein
LDESKQPFGSLRGEVALMGYVEFELLLGRGCANSDCPALLPTFQCVSRQVRKGAVQLGRDRSSRLIDRESVGSEGPGDGFADAPRTSGHDDHPILKT